MNQLLLSVSRLFVLRVGQGGFRRGGCGSGQQRGGDSRFNWEGREGEREVEAGLVAVLVREGGGWVPLARVFVMMMLMMTIAIVGGMISSSEGP